jgi:hypothetical protein
MSQKQRPQIWEYIAKQNINAAETDGGRHPNGARELGDAGIRNR